MSTRSTDPETNAMAALVKVLGDLDEPARHRVLRWLSDRYLPVSSAPISVAAHDGRVRAIDPDIIAAAVLP